MPDQYDITHGAGGLWEVHEWNSDFMLCTTAGRDRIQVDRITGLHSLPDRDDTGTPKMGRIGENFFPTSPLGKTVTYEGSIRASSLKLLRVARTEMLAAFSDTYSYGTMDIIPQLQTYDTSPLARYYAKVLALDVGPEEITEQDWTRPFVLSLRLIDPRIYFIGLQVNVSGSPAAVTNTGNAPVDPVLHVTVSSPGTVSVSDGTHTLQFLNVPAGTLDIDFGARTAAVGGTAVELDVPNSDWWDSNVPGISPGAHSISQTGGTAVRVVFVPAVWG